MISSPFLAKEPFRDKAHTGVDIPLEEGTPLKALSDGVIKLADYGDVNAGKTVLLQTDSGETFVYGHLSDFLVEEGQRVGAGQTIALSGNTGNVIGNGHLHLGLKDAQGQYIDPTQYADSVTGDWLGSKLQAFLGNKVHQFIDRGSVDSYDPIIQSLPDLLTSLATEQLIVLVGVLLLFFNRFTRPFTIAGLLLLLII